MQKVPKAKYLIPGILMPEEMTVDLDDYSPIEAAEKAPDAAYCFTIYRLPVVDFHVPSGFDVTPKPRDESNRYYLGGMLYSLEEIEDMAGMDILACNMRCNGWDRVILCRTGNWQPFEKGDAIL